MNAEPQRALAPGVAPPRRIDLGDLVVRQWRPEDLVPSFEAVAASYEHLHPWAEWLPEPPPLEQQRAFGDAVASSWPGPDGGCHYGIFDAGGSVVGATGFHDRLGPHALEIGYWCHVRHTGRGIITRTTEALTRAALALPDIERVEIHCDEANVRSAAIPRRLGYRLDRVEERQVRAPAESGRTMIWVIDGPLAR
ncbi:GNAT family N-acetyltransferase [Nocardia farcinica]|uniref:GNAT family N-acetyltransferase n=1 Tax=Nocardia farcinica TaxID=37329 RepID=UPI002457231A|nr:GNAT family N-acetyltransferase [Nocardia farcinica]